MGFLHLGWDIAAREESAADSRVDSLSLEWEAAAAEMDLKRPGLTAVRLVMGWSPLHMAAMEGKVGLIRRLVKEFGCSLTQRSANSWTPLHYAAAHNQVLGRQNAPAEKLLVQAEQCEIGKQEAQM